MSNINKVKNNTNQIDKILKEKQINDKITTIKENLFETLNTLKEAIKNKEEKTEEKKEEENKEINILLKECSNLMEENIKKIELIRNIKQKIHKKITEIENYENSIKIENKIEITKNKNLQQKIDKQRKELDKLLTYNNIIKRRLKLRRKNKEIYIIEPYKKTILLNSELISNRRLLKELLKANNNQRKQIKNNISGIELYTVMNDIYSDNISVKDNKIEENDLNLVYNKNRSRSLSFS